MLEKCVLTILEFNWNQRLGHKETKLNIFDHVVHTTARQVISRRRKNDNVFEKSKNEKCTCKACKYTVFHCQICKFVGFFLLSSSWLLKLPKGWFSLEHKQKHKHKHKQSLVFTSDASTSASISASIRHQCQVKTNITQAQVANASISASTRKRKNFDPCAYACACACACVEPVFTVKYALLCLRLYLPLCLRR